MRRHLTQALSVPALAAAAALCTLGGAADTRADTVASDRFDSSSNLKSFSQTPSLAEVQVWVRDDWFGQLDPQNPPALGIPRSIADDSKGTYPTDRFGVVDNSPDSNATGFTSGFKHDKYFGTTDVENDYFTGTATATWEFDIRGAARVTAVSIDMGAMGDFESANDRFDWFWQIDGQERTPLFTSSVNDGVFPMYVMANGTMIFDVRDPLMINNAQLLTEKTAPSGLATRTAAISGSGNTLTLSFEAEANGGDEAYVFDNILIIGEPDVVVRGDVNLDGAVNGLDVNPFVARVLSGNFQPEADTNKDGAVNGLDVEPFVDLVLNLGVGVVPEPSTWALAWVGLVMLGIRRRRCNR